MLQAAFIALLTAAQAQTSVAPSSVEDPLAAIAGDWQVVDHRTGKAIMDCQNYQRFAVSPDRRAVTLSGPWTETPVRYVVLHSEKNRALMFVEGERRLTKHGDPVLWWAYFDGPDRFAWRQYDWLPEVRTTSEWRRCPIAK